MNKEELIKELLAKVATGEISREYVLSQLNFPPGAQKRVADAKGETHFSVTKMLYVLGAAIVVIGIIIFVFLPFISNTPIAPSFFKLGLGFLLTAIGSFLLKQKPEDHIGSVFHFMGGLLVPGGAMVTLSELGLDFVSLWPVALTFGAIFVFYLLINSIHKSAILTFFTIANGTAFIYLVVESITDGSFYMHGDLYAYLTMVVGASYLLLAYSFRGGWNDKLVEVLYFFGIAGFLGAAFSQVFGSVPWQMLYFIIVIGGLFLSAYIKSRAVLVVSTLFLIAHVSYITSEYFANSVGWPVALILLGFIFIGLGYVSITINKKYIKA